jgi:hypothetical protein
MKNTFWKLCACILFGLLFHACQREAVTLGDDAQSIQGSANCPDRAQFVHGKTYRQYIADYVDLPPAKKKCLWEDKLTHSLNFFQDEGQRGFIAQARTSLNTPQFVHGNPEGYEDAFLDAAKLHFTFEEIFHIFMVLHDYDAPLLPMGPNAGGGNGTGNCECYYSISCGIFGLCLSGNCVKASGCGIFHGTNCVGLCEQ